MIIEESDKKKHFIGNDITDELNSELNSEFTDKSSDGSSDGSGDENNIFAYIRLFLRRIVNVRSLAYTSEISEAGRPVLHKGLLYTGYALSFGYVGADIGIKLYDIKDYPQEVIMYKGIDLSLWHTSASIVTPAVTIHTIVSSVTKFQNRLIHTSKYFPQKLRILFPTLVGLSSIPLIIKPIDNMTDFVMNNSIRKMYPVEIPHEHHH